MLHIEAAGRRRALRLVAFGLVSGEAARADFGVMRWSWSIGRCDADYERNQPGGAQTVPKECNLLATSTAISIVPAAPRATKGNSDNQANQNSKTQHHDRYRVFQLVGAFSSLEHINSHNHHPNRDNMDIQQNKLDTLSPLRTSLVTHLPSHR